MMNESDNRHVVCSGMVNHTTGLELDNFLSCVASYHFCSTLVYSNSYKLRPYLYNSECDTQLKVTGEMIIVLLTSLDHHVVQHNQQYAKILLMIVIARVCVDCVTFRINIRSSRR